MSTEVRTRERASAEEPDVGFQCGVGLCVGTVLAGVVSVALAATGSSAVSVLATYPTVMTVGLVAGALLSRSARGLPERLGADRRRWLSGLVPASALGAGAALAWLAGLPRVAAAGALAALPVALSGLVLVAMARNRYIDSVTGEPAASWAWKRTGFFRREYMVLALSFGWPGFVLLTRGQWEVSVVWLCVLLVVAMAGAHRLRVLDDSGWLDQWESEGVPELAVHDAGLVASEGLTKSLVPWSRIEGVSLTDDELAIDRGWRTIRCDREVIDDPDRAYEALRTRIGEGRE